MTSSIQTGFIVLIVTIQCMHLLNTSLAEMSISLFVRMTCRNCECNAYMHDFMCECILNMDINILHASIAISIN